MALPVVDTKQPGVKELISGSVKDIANMIFASASVSITAAAKAVTPSIPEMVADITEDLRAGPVNRFSQGLEKLDKLLQNFGGEIRDYSKELAKFVDQREARISKSEKTIRELRENNIKAEIGSMGEVKILTQEMIQKREEELKKIEEDIKLSKERIVVGQKMVQEDGNNKKQVRNNIIREQENVIEQEQKREKILESLNKKEEDTSDDARKTIRERASNIIEEYVPDGLRDIGSAFVDGLMAPVNAVKDLGRLFGGLLKPLKALPKLFKGFIVGMMGAIASLLPFIAIALGIVIAIGLVITGMIKLMEVIEENKESLLAFKDRIMEIPGKIKDFFDEKFDALGLAFEAFVEDVKAIPGKISDFFTTIFNKIQNFFIDAINGVIGMYNKLPLPDIEPLESVPMPASEPAEIVPADSKGTVSAAQSGAVSTAGQGLPFLDTNNSQSNTNNATIIDNSVKSNMQNNSTTTGGLNGARDFDLKILDQMYSNASA